jgi:hypothetical protein
MLKASEKQLQNFYNILTQYFPHSLNEGIAKPHDHTWEGTQTWHAARSHVAKLIEEKRLAKRHWQVWIVGFLTFIVLYWTLADTIYARSNKVEKPVVRFQPAKL